MNRNAELLMIQDKEGNTPLHLICRNNKFRWHERFDSLLEDLIPKDVEARHKLLQLCNEDQQTPLDLALLRQPPATADQIRALMVWDNDNDDHHHHYDDEEEEHPAHRRNHKHQLLPIDVVFGQLNECRGMVLGRNHECRSGCCEYQEPECYCIFVVPELALWELLLPRDVELKRVFFKS
jgi:hypothetical protein